MEEIRCPQCNALNLKIDDRSLIEVKIGAFALRAEGNFNNIEVTCRNRDCRNIFIIK